MAKSSSNTLQRGKPNCWPLLWTHHSVKPPAHRIVELLNSYWLSTLTPIYAKEAAHLLSFGRSEWPRLSMSNNCWNIGQIHWRRKSSTWRATWKICWPTTPYGRHSAPFVIRHWIVTSNESHCHVGHHRQNINGCL